MEDYSEVFVGMDVSKSRIAIALAEGGGAREARFLGEIEASEASVTKLVRRLSAKYGKPTFCYEAGPTGYGLYRLIGEFGHECRVVAPSLIPRKPGDRVKTNRRDALSLARLLRAGELTSVWAPDERHEAMRDLVRARSAAAARSRTLANISDWPEAKIDSLRRVLAGETLAPLGAEPFEIARRGAGPS